MDARASLAGFEGMVAAYDALLKKLKDEYAASVSDAASADLVRRSFVSAENRLTSLENELENARVAESRDPARFEVVDQPDGSGEITYPKRSIFALGGFVLALAIQLLLERSKPRAS
jgi:hypothetical protein